MVASSCRDTNLECSPALNAAKHTTMPMGALRFWRPNRLAHFKESKLKTIL